MESDGNYRQQTGREGEDIVCGYLAKLGHVILERNWRNGHLEIDIISLDAEGIHFVEVKARRKSIQAPPQDNVDRNKQRRIATAAKRYLCTKGKSLSGKYECFFDVAAVTFEGETVHMEWIPQAYIPMYL